MAEKISLTPEMRQRLTDELKWLETVERAKAEKEIEMAKELGDLSNNAEYIAACDYQDRVEKRIQQLKQVLEQA